MNERRSIRELNKAIRREPKNAALRVERGDYYRERGKIHHASALRDYGDAIRLDPDCAEAYFGRGLVYVREGRYSDAIRDYERAVRLNFTLSHADYAEAYHDRGQAYFNRGEYDRAIQDFDKVICLVTLDASILIYLAQFTITRGLPTTKKVSMTLQLKTLMLSFA